MKTSKIGELNLGRLKTEIHATENVKSKLKKEKISNSFLIPTAWLWYDSELIETTDENGDGKIDDKFGKEFKIIYLSEEDSAIELEQEALQLSKTTIKNISLKYAILKSEKP
jgi:hypothetical protein